MPLDIGPSSGADRPPHPSLLKPALVTTRAHSAEIVEPLSLEDRVVQAGDDASPAKWHLAHTTWFFEELILKPYLPGYRIFNEAFSYCFNSYYESLGPRHPRPKRGLLTRPSSADVMRYRTHVDEALERLLARDAPETALDLIEIGIHHEQQHQELMLTDILALFAASPIYPVYRPQTAQDTRPAPRESWSSFSEGLYVIGHEGQGFAYDNEGPSHRVFLQDFRLCDQLVTNGDWLAFMDDGGYANPALWLSDGFAFAQDAGWNAPGYWQKIEGRWRQMTLNGLRGIDQNRPVCHVSYYEADAFARWAGHRLPTEFEWETASQAKVVAAQTFAPSRLVPDFPREEPLSQLFGDVWEWTASAYLPYPRYKPAPGPLGEYNGKFMCNQFVLRGGSLATPNGHIRKTYRNFFYPHQRWQFMGVRLASDV